VYIEWPPLLTKAGGLINMLSSMRTYGRKSLPFWQ
jgi:hypothetical protein